MTKRALPQIGITAQVAARNRIWGRQIVDDTDSRIRPWNLSSFTAEDYVLKDGNPFVTPLMLVAETVLSATGEYAVLDRPGPFDIDMSDSVARFTPSDASWDPIATTWQPSSTSGYDYKWTAVSGTEPFLQDMTYRLGKELITTNCLYFPTGSFLTSSFNQGLDDAASYAVVMVVSLEQPTPYDFFAGVSGDDKLVMTVTGEKLTASVSQGAATITPKQHPVDMTPLYLVLNVFPGSMSFWAGTAPQKMVQASSVTGTQLMSHMRFQLGRNQFGTAAANFRLLDWSLWPRSLSSGKDEYSVFTVVSKYASIYGAW